MWWWELGEYQCNSMISHCSNNYELKLYDTHIRVFDMFWSMGRIGSTVVSVCAIGNTIIHLDPINRVTDNIYNHNELCHWPNKRTVQSQIRSSLGRLVCNIRLSKTLTHMLGIEEHFHYWLIFRTTS